MENEAPVDSLKALAQLGEDLFDATADVLRLEAELKRAKHKRDALECETIPEFMAEIGMTAFETDKSKVRIKDILAVSPKKDNRPLVLQDLEKRGQGGLIKDVLTMSFAKGEGGKVDTLVKELMAQGFHPERARGVHAQTLKKFVKGILEAGDSIDLELYGVRQIKRAEFESGAPEAPIFDGE